MEHVHRPPPAAVRITARGEPAVGGDSQRTAGCEPDVMDIEIFLAVAKEVKESLVASDSFTADHRRSLKLFWPTGCRG